MEVEPQSLWVKRDVEGNLEKAKVLAKGGNGGWRESTTMKRLPPHSLRESENFSGFGSFHGFF